MELKFAVLLLALSLFACVTNPRFTDPKWIAEERIKKYPEQSDEIRNSVSEFERKRYTESANPLNQASPFRYEILPEKMQGIAVGDPSALLQVGAQKYQYHHTILAQLFCPTEGPFPRYLSRKNISWNLDDQKQGVAQTDTAGNLKIKLVGSEAGPFRELKISFGGQIYTFRLQGELRLPLSEKECLQK